MEMVNKRFVIQDRFLVLKNFVGPQKTLWTLAYKIQIPKLIESDIAFDGW